MLITTAWNHTWSYGLLVRRICTVWQSESQQENHGKERRFHHFVFTEFPSYLPNPLTSCSEILALFSTSATLAESSLKNFLSMCRRRSPLLPFTQWHLTKRWLIKPKASWKNRGTRFQPTRNGQMEVSLKRHIPSALESSWEGRKLGIFSLPRFRNVRAWGKYLVGWRPPVRFYVLQTLASISYRFFFSDLLLNTNVLKTPPTILAPIFHQNVLTNCKYK